MVEIISEGKHKGKVKGFRHTSRAWYRDSVDFKQNVVDEVMFGFYDYHEGGSTGEMSMKWVRFQDSKPAAQLRVFDDGWHALYQFQDLLAKLAELNNESITPLQFCAVLLSCGFVDMTERTPGDQSWRSSI